MENNPFPPGFEGMENIIKNAREKIQRIDTQLKNTSNSGRPQNRFNPPGYGIRRPGNSDKIIQQLKLIKENIKSRTMAKLEKASRGRDLKTSRRIMDDLTNEFYPNPYGGMEKRGLKRILSTPRTHDQSSYYARRLWEVARSAAKPSPQPEAAAPKQEANVRKGPVRMSDRFTQRLGHTPNMPEPKAAKEVKSPEKTTPQSFAENKRDMIKAEKSMSMSDRFSQSQGYRNIPTAAAKRIGKDKGFGMDER